MIKRSLFGPLPPVPVANAHDILFRDLGVADYDLFIDGLTGQRLSRLGFKQRVVNLATAFTAPKRVGGLHFTPQEDIVGIFAPNSIDFCTIVHASFLVTVPVVLFPSSSTAHELADLLKRSKTTRLFAHSSRLKTALSAIERAGFPKHCLYLVDQAAGGRPSVDSAVNNVVVKDLPRERPHELHSSTIAYMIFSSGTSGVPKAVMISHVNVIASVMSVRIFGEELERSMADAGIPSRNDTRKLISSIDIASFLLSGEVSADSVLQPHALCVLPMYHSYGLYQYVLRGLLVPQTIVVLPRFDINLVFDLIEEYRIEMMSLVPSQVHEFLNSPRLATTDLSSLRRIGSGAAYLPPAMSNKMQTVLKSRTLMPGGYGLSESTVGTLFKPPIPFFRGKLPANAACTGILLPGFEARIVRSVTHAKPKPGQKVGDIVEVVDADLHEPGELWLRGIPVAMGYFGDAQATRETFLPDGWLRTGDRFRADEHGYFYYEDRIKDTLKVGGVQVSPTEIESCIADLPDGVVEDVSVIGVQPPSARLGKDEKWPRAYVVLTAKGRALGEEQAAAKISDWVRDRLSKSKRLRGGIAFVHQIPKSPTGKVLRRVLQEQYEAEQATRTSRKAKAKL